MTTRTTPRSFSSRRRAACLVPSRRPRSTWRRSRCSSSPHGPTPVKYWSERRDIRLDFCVGTSGGAPLGKPWESSSPGCSRSSSSSSSSSSLLPLPPWWWFRRRYRRRRRPRTDHRTIRTDGRIQLSLFSALFSRRVDDARPPPPPPPLVPRRLASLSPKKKRVVFSLSLSPGGGGSGFSTKKCDDIFWSPILKKGLGFRVNSLSKSKRGSLSRPHTVIML